MKESNPQEGAGKNKKENIKLFSLIILPWLAASSPNCGDKKLVRFLF